jgi:hypothetical protein
MPAREPIRTALNGLIGIYGSEGWRVATSNCASPAPTIRTANAIPQRHPFGQVTRVEEAGANIIGSKAQQREDGT